MTIKEIQEKIEKIAQSRNVYEKNAKEDNKVKMVDQIPNQNGLTFISLYGQQAFFISKEKRLLVYLCNKKAGED